MRSLLPLLIVGASLAAAGTAGAQQPRTIDAGMTTDEVRAALGPPDVVREADGWTYYFYTNRCLPRCGTDDTVFFRDGRVVSAVLHAPARRYAGPPAAPALGEATAAEPRDAASASGGAPVTGIRVRTGAAAQAPPVDLGVIRGRLRDADRAGAAGEPAPVGAEPAARPPEPDADASAARPPAPQAEPTAERPAATPAPTRQPVDNRTREERIEANTIRRPPRP